MATGPIGKRLEAARYAAWLAAQQANGIVVTRIVTQSDKE
jgi:hypothetical protein